MHIKSNTTRPDTTRQDVSSQAPKKKKKPDDP